MYIASSILIFSFVCWEHIARWLRDLHFLKHEQVYSPSTKRIPLSCINGSTCHAMSRARPAWADVRACAWHFYFQDIQQESAYKDTFGPQQTIAW